MRYKAFLGLGAVAALFAHGIGALTTLDFRHRERDPMIPPRPSKKDKPARKVFVPRPVATIADRYTSIRKLENGAGPLMEPTDRVREAHIHPRSKRTAARTKLV